MNKMLAALLLLMCSTAWATNESNPPNPCGNHGNNCQQGGGGTSVTNDNLNWNDIRNTNTNVNANTATGGSASATGGDVRNSGNSRNDNTNVAVGGAGGEGGAGYGGDQAQGQSQSSTNKQGQSQNAVAVNEVSATGSGNVTTVDAQDHSSTLVERNAPPVFLGNLTATMSCSGSFNAGGSDRNGSGAFGFTWISKDCRQVVMGREFAGIGMVDVACRIWKASDGYKRAVKRDPSLANVDCAVKPSAPAVKAEPVSFVVPRIPRG